MAHTAATAREAFEARSSEVRVLRARLGFALAEKEDRATADPANWGHAGDMAHVAGLLRQAVAFLGGEEG
jgi:hypothetical protein